MSIRTVGTGISTSNGPVGGILRLLKNWNRSNGGVALACATQAPLLPRIHNRVHLRYQLPVTSIIRQFSLAPSLLSQHATVAPSDKAQPQDDSQHKGKKNKREPAKAWTLEEDIDIYNCLLENQQIVDFYHRFPGRTMGSVNTRVFRLRNACFIPPDKGGLAEDADMPVAQRVEVLRRIMYKYTVGQSKAEGYYATRTTSTRMKYWLSKKNSFSEQEKEMLAKLVYKYRNSANMWVMVSGGRLVDEEGAPRLNRLMQSCKTTWREMNKDKSMRTGAWDKDERQRLVEAIRGQVGDEYEIYLDVTQGGSGGTNQSATATSESDTKPALRLGSSALQKLNWQKIASKVLTRTGQQCRDRFYVSMHNGNTEKWTAEEKERLLEGFKLYGRQWEMVAAHVGMRSHRQASQKYLTMQKIAKKITD